MMAARPGVSDVSPLMAGPSPELGPARPVTAPLLPPDLASFTTLLTQHRTTQNLEIMFQTLRQLHSTELLVEQFLLLEQKTLAYLNFSSSIQYKSEDFNLFLSLFLLSNKRSSEPIQFNCTLIT